MKPQSIKIVTQPGKQFQDPFDKTQEDMIVKLKKDLVGVFFMSLFFFKPFFYKFGRHKAGEHGNVRRDMKKKKKNILEQDTCLVSRPP